MITSSVRWEGLTKMVFDLQYGVPRRMDRGIEEHTKRMGENVHQAYVDNLSGSVPSTAARPLPVGVRSGHLLASAEMVIVNQYRADVENKTHYAGFIEDGTRFMAPRRPLGDAVDLVGKMVPGSMGKVMTSVLIQL